jgi:hypothetical protein
LLDGKKLGESSSVPYAFALPNSLSRGLHKLEVRAFNAGKLAVNLVQAFTVK